MKWMGGAVAIVLAGFLAFQNCQQAPHPGDLSNAGQDSSDGNVTKTDLQGQKISEVHFLFSENESVNRNSGSYQLAVNKTLKIALPSGEVIVSSDLDRQTSRYCLTETLTNEVIHILKTSQVCKKPDPPPGQICTMVVKLPYAEIVAEKETFSLGGASDGCGSNSFDLCGEQAEVLQGFIASIKANYKSFSCPQ
jgi:hypothetical protein